ncbi:hypothetical protein AO070_04725 [Pseudomonas syringae pv. syringae PD2766]|uniref:putative phage abortive infection protein n=1 Tax=Pseudomonas syringae TaxID=317 RepID=UPI0007364770|nr:putative phage abortive infection protein [Pseudomonas syringae]KTB87919.1 hypothetical protein AO070_04725 [Pseudomonas syringae pv. syringae PD2766]
MDKFSAEFAHRYNYSKFGGVKYLLRWLCFKVFQFVGSLTPLLIGVAAVSAIFCVGGAVYYHFFLGLDIPNIEIKNSGSASYWGQIGDFVGGLLNPLLSFAALMAVLLSLKAQRKELSLARADAKENHRIQEQQSQIFERQNFESLFFRLLDIHARLSKEITLDPKDFEGALQATHGKRNGEDAFNFLRSYYFPGGLFYATEEEYEVAILKSSKNFSSRCHLITGHYFRNLYQILKQVDNFGVDPLRMSRPTSFVNMRVRLQNYYIQRNYANMLRAQLSSSELRVIFINCLSQRGSGLKYLVERYSLLKHFDKSIFSKFSLLGSKLFDPIAFADYEELTQRQIRTHINDWPKRDVS